MTTSLLDMVEDTLKFEYLAGAVTPLQGTHTTGLRNLPYAVCAAISGGTTRLYFDDTGEFTLQAGQAFVAPAGMRHSSTLNCDFNISRWAHFQVTVFDAVDAFHLFSIPHTLAEGPAAKMGQVCEELATLTQTPASETTIACIARRKALGFRLFAIIAEAGWPCTAGNALLDSMQRLRPLLQRMHASPEQPMTLGEMSALVHLSPSRFSALFRTRLGISPGKYQQNIRINAAKTALLDSRKSIVQIADDLGFREPFHFSKAFKKSTGLNPRLYRTQLQKGMWQNRNISTLPAKL